MVSLFLSTALVLGTSGCTSPEQKVVYDNEGNPIVQQDNSRPGFFSGFFGPFGPLGPFGFFSGRAYGASSGAVRSPGVPSSRVPSSGLGAAGSSQNPVDADGSSATKGTSEFSGVSPWGRSGSTSSSGGSSSGGGAGITSGSTSSSGKSSSGGGTGITSGSHGGIGGGGTSAS